MLVWLHRRLLECLRSCNRNEGFAKCIQEGIPSEWLSGCGEIKSSRHVGHVEGANVRIAV